MAQRQGNVRIVGVEVVQIIPEEVRGTARLRRHELRVAILPRAGHSYALLDALACGREGGVEGEDAGDDHAADVAAVDLFCVLCPRGFSGGWRRPLAAPRAGGV